MDSVTPNSSFYLPSVDISSYLQAPNSTAGRLVVDDVRKACTSTGFFQLLGHGVSAALQQNLFNAAAKFFALPANVKLPLDVKKHVGFRGYDVMASQSYEEDVLPDLKEGFIMGNDIPLDDPRVLKRRFFMGQNVWPSTEILPYKDFQQVVEEYNEAMLKLSWVVLDLIAATLPYGPGVFEELKQNDPACPLRLLHYPPTQDHVGDSRRRQLGSSAHTDFGFITLLLQDENPGLEVHDQKTGRWIGVPPNKDAYVVNMGDMISTVTGGLYKSSIHRVMNNTPKDRYSVVFFVDGNLDYKLQRLDRISQPGKDEVVLNVEEYMEERRRTSYKLPRK
jgi:isopenicillin N synthase-like dioxygenase